MPYRGVNLAGAEFGVASDGTGQNPGTFGSTYTWPSATSADYFLAKGMNTFRVPFRWERLQRTRGAALDAAEVSRLRATVNGITSRGGVVLLDPHNYARYGTEFIGSGTVTDAQFADFWSRLASEFKSNPNVLFGLMNEPYGLPTEQWVTSANAAIVAIRATGATNLILVPGNAWTGAHSWTHPNLARVGPTALHAELARPLAWLRLFGERALAWLAFPYGCTSPAVQVAARDAGYVAGLRVEGGWLPAGAAQPLGLPRINVPAGLTDAGFTLRTAGILR